MDRGLRARQALRFVKSGHVSETEESYAVIHRDDPGLFRLRALAGSSTEKPDEEEWPVSWQQKKGGFQGWVKCNLTKWVREISHELQKKAEGLKKEEDAAAAKTTTQQDTTDTPVENKDASAQSLVASPEAQSQASEPRDATGISPSIEDLGLDSEHGHSDKTDTLPAPQNEKTKALGDTLGIPDGHLANQFGRNTPVTEPDDTIHEPMHPEPSRPELPIQIGANTPAPPSLTGHGRSAVSNSPRRETRSNVVQDQQQQPSTSTVFDKAPPFAQAPTAETNAPSTPTSAAADFGPPTRFFDTEDSVRQGSDGDTWAWRSNTIPAVCNLFSGNPFATRTPAHVPVLAPGQTRLGGSEDRDKLTMANLSIHEASAPTRKSEKPPKEWYEWYKLYHSNQKDSV